MVVLRLPLQHRVQAVEDRHAALEQLMIVLRGLCEAPDGQVDACGLVARELSNGLPFPASLVRQGNFIYVTNLSLDLRLFNPTFTIRGFRMGRDGHLSHRVASPRPRRCQVCHESRACEQRT